MSQLPIIIKPDALAILKRKFSPNQTILLALNDGSNKYSSIGGTCTIGANFQFVGLNAPDPQFDVELTNDAGLKLYTSNNELAFISGTMVVNAKNSLLSLSDDSGLLDGALSTQIYQPSAITAEEMVNGKVC